MAAEAEHLFGPIYQRLGFTPGETVAPGPDGGARQLYRLTR